MNIYIDITIILFLIFLIFWHFKVGLAKSVYSIFSFVLGIFLTKLIYPNLNLALKNSFLFDKLTLYFVNRLSLEEIFNEISPSISTDIINNLSEQSSLSGYIAKFLFESQNFNISKIIDFSQIEFFIANYISSFIIGIFCFVLVFLSVFIILKILSKFIDFTFKLPVLNLSNRILGALFGFLKGILIIWVIFIIISIISLSPQYSFLKENILKSNLGAFLYKNNYLFLFILNYFKSMFKL